MNKTLEEFIKLSMKEYYQEQDNYASLYNLLSRCRQNKFYHFGYYCGKILEKLGDWRYLDELSICAYWIGEYQESYDLCKRAMYICPEEDKDRIVQNKKYAIDKLGIKEVFSLEQFKKDTAEEISKLNYKKYFYQFNEQEKEKLAKEMKAIETFFKTELDLDVYPVYGTLLGIIRDKDFIGWDTDVDVAYLSKYHTNEEVKIEFEKICKFLEEKKLLMHRIKTMSHLHVYSPSKAFRTDLWISWVDNEEKYHIIWTVAGDIDSTMILPFKTVEFKSQKLLQMNDPERFLHEHYPNWKVPLDGTEKNWAKRKPIFELESWKGK